MAPPMHRMHTERDVIVAKSHEPPIERQHHLRAHPRRRRRRGGPRHDRLEPARRRPRRGREQQRDRGAAPAGPRVVRPDRVQPSHAGAGRPEPLLRRDAAVARSTAPAAVPGRARRHVRLRRLPQGDPRPRAAEALHDPGAPPDHPPDALDAHGGPSMRRGLVQSKRWLVVVALGAGVAAGCAAPLAGDIPAYPTASQLEVDTQACEQGATGRAEFERRADYMACMISRGYRTYVTVATYWNLAELNVLAAGKGKQAQAQQAQSQVLLDLQTCATDAGALAGLVSECLGKRGYTARAPKRLASD